MRLRRAICGILVGGLLLSVTTAVFADSTKENSKRNCMMYEKCGFRLDGAANRLQEPGKRKGMKQNNINKSEALKTVLNKLVEEKKLSQAKVDSILKYLTDNAAKRKEFIKNKTKDQKIGNRTSFFEDLIANNIITADEAEAIKTKMKEMREERFDNNIKGLIDKGIITQSDAEAIKSYLENRRNERREKCEQLKNMTPEQKKEYFKNCNKERKDIFQEMVDNGIIKSSQAEELRKAFHK